MNSVVLVLAESLVIHVHSEHELYACVFSMAHSFAIFDDLASPAQTRYSGSRKCLHAARCTLLQSAVYPIVFHDSVHRLLGKYFRPVQVLAAICVERELGVRLQGIISKNKE